MSSPTGSSLKFIHSETHRACASCASAKAKCIPLGPAGSASCERCLRLNKACNAQPKHETSRGRRRGPRAHSTLAQKVDEIVALLAHKPGGLDGNSGSATPASDPATEASVAPQTLALDPAEADVLLHHFRQNQAVFAPFVQIPEGATACSLRGENYMLFLAVMVAASHDDPRRQETLSRASMAYVADQVLVQGRKNLALLQGMLVLLNWYHTQVFLNPQITNLLHLCISLTTDLGLTQSPSRPEVHTLSYGARRAIHGPSVYPEERTLEERRAYAGCFYLASAIATSSTVSTELPWTAQLEESCQVLRSSGLDADSRLEMYVRLQHIVAQITQVQKDIAANGGPAASLTVYIAPFEERLTQLWNDCPESLRNDTHIRLSHHITVMHLYKISINDSINPRASADPTVAVTRHQARQRCLREANASLEIYMSVPPRCFYHHSLAQFSQVGHAMTIIARLYRPDPSSALSSPYYALPAVLERVAAHIDCVLAEGRNDRLAQWATWLQMCIRRLEIVGEGDGVGGADDAVGVGQDGEARGDVGAGATTVGSLLPVVSGEVSVASADELGTMRDADFFGTDWAAMMEEVSGFGLFGFADDDALMQSIFAGADATQTL